MQQALGREKKSVCCLASVKGKIILHHFTNLRLELLVYAEKN